MQVTSYRDGGTRSFKDYTFDKYFNQKDVEICQDNRIGVVVKNIWYLGYPEKGRLLTEEERIFVVNEVIAHLGRELQHAKYLYENIKDVNMDCTFKDDFQKVFSLKSSESRGDYRLITYKSKDGFVLINENDICLLKDEDNVVISGGSLKDIFEYYLDYKN